MIHDLSICPTRIHVRGTCLDLELMAELMHNGAFGILIRHHRQKSLVKPRDGVGSRHRKSNSSVEAACEPTVGVSGCPIVRKKREKD